MERPVRTGAVQELNTLFGNGVLVGLSDAELLAQLVDAGNERGQRAFEAILRRHGPMVFGVCRRVLGDRHAAEDVFQATFTILLVKARSVRDHDALGPWLHTVAARLSRRHGARIRRVQLAESLPDVAALPCDDVPRVDLRGVLDEELNRLPAKYRQPLVLCFLEGRTQEEAARELGWAKGTVSGRIARAKDLLRARLSRRGIAPALVLAGIAAASEAATTEVPEALAQATIRSQLLAVTNRAGSAGAALALTLAREELRSMLVKKLSVLTTLVIATAACALVFTDRTGKLPHAAIAQAAEPDTKKTPAPPIDVPAGVRAGRVVDTDGKPIEGVTIVGGRIARAAPNQTVTRTGSDGRFTLREPDGPYPLSVLIAYKQGYSPDCVFEVPRTIRVQPESDVTFVLCRPAPFFGQVVDAEGRPIKGAEVRIREASLAPETGHRSLVVHDALVPETPLEHLFVTRTDDDGRFRFDVLTAGARARLAVTAEGMGAFDTLEFAAQAPRVVPPPRGERPRLDLVSGTEDAPARITLEPAARISGRVVTRLKNVSTAGLHVGLQGATRRSHGVWKDAISDETGRFVIDGVPNGGFNVFLTDHPSAGDWTYRAANDIALRAGGVEKVEIELIEGVLANGRVEDASSGEPVAGVGIGVYGPIRPSSGAAIISTRTDAQGRYQFRLPAGETRFYICGPLPAGYEPADPRRSSIEVEIPRDRREMTISLIRVRRTVNGRERE